MHWFSPLDERLTNSGVRNTGFDLLLLNTLQAGYRVCKGFKIYAVSKITFGPTSVLDFRFKLSTDTNIPAG